MVGMERKGYQQPIEVIFITLKMLDPNNKKNN